MKKCVKVVVAAALSASLLQAGVAMADTIRLHGAASTVDSLITPHKGVVEQASGYRLDVVKSNAGKGLVDLVEGKCDAALASASLETTVQAAKAAGKDIDPSGLQLHVIKSDEVVFVVNPKNPVKNLTLKQIRDLHTGKITNWKQVGGADTPVRIVTDTLSSATRGLIRQSVLKGDEYVKDAVPVSIDQVSDEVAKQEGAIGGLGLGFVKKNMVSIVKAEKVERPLGLITVGPPSDGLKKVIEAYRTAVGR